MKRSFAYSAVLLAGTLGSGKTVAAQTIAYTAERHGSLVVDFDPKPDHGWQHLPELQERLEVLERGRALQLTTWLGAASTASARASALAVMVSA